MQRNVAIGLAAASLPLVLALAGAWLYADLLPSGQPLRGTTLAGASQRDGESLEGWLTRTAAELGTRPALIDTGDSMLQVSLAQVGAELDIPRTRRTVLDQATSGNVLQRLARAFRARRAEEQVPLSWAFNRDRARAFLNELAPSVARDAENARVDLSDHRKVPDEPGRELDVGASLSLLEAAVQSQANRFALAFRALPAQATVDDLIRVDIGKVLASFETDFKGHAGRRKINIERAAKYLDGTVIGPGEVFSFNRSVGLRTESRGFVEAPVIIDDLMDSGIGGGVCQVASTLFAAAVYGNLEIVRRRSHSRPSGYAPLGLDATVIDHEVDLRLRNPYAVPLLIHAFLPNETAIRVELLGYDSQQKVSHAYSVTERYDFVRRVKYTTEVTAPKRKQRGHYGFDVISVVSVAGPSGTLQRHTYPSKYYPVPEVYWVPPDYDISALPPLPEGATKTVIGDDSGDDGAAAPDSKMAEPPS